MSQFTLDVYQLAKVMPRVASRPENDFVRAGRSTACEFIEAIRLGHWEEIDSLQAALTIATGGGPEVLGGFLRELTDAIREGAV